jgi:hypothetical protein
MPFKVNQDRRHHIPKQRYRVTNWADYDAALRRRGSLTIWFTDAGLRLGVLSPALRVAANRPTRPWQSLRR